MALVTTDRLNTYHREGIVPIKTAVTELQEAMILEQGNVDDLEEAVSSLQNSIGGGIVTAYIRTGGDELESSWLSTTSSSGEALTPQGDVLYVILTEGEHYNYLYRWDENSSQYELCSGGGTGSGGNVSNATFILRNTDNWTNKFVVTDASVVIPINWSCIENEYPTGDGVLVLSVGGTVRETRNVVQGNLTLNVTDYLSIGNNNITISITDGYENTKRLVLTVSVVSLTISSSFDSTVLYDDDILFTYTPLGSANKTVHIKVDGTEVYTTNTSVSNRQLSYNISALPYGSHTIQAYFTAILDGANVTSNILNYEFISINGVESTSMPVIITNITENSIPQYTNLNIGYMVYTPSSITSNVSISVNGDQVSSQVVSRGQQTYVHRATNIGSLVITITSGSTVKTLNITVTDSGMDIGAVTDQLKLFLTSTGRSNNEINKAIWEDTDNNIVCSLNNFNWVNNGWIIDSEGVTTLRVSNGATVTIPYKIFGSDFKTKGKTIEIEFSARYVTDVTATIMTCMANNMGILVTPQTITLTSEQSSISTQFKEDEHIRIGFVVEKTSENRLIYCYINGIKSGVIQYPTTDNFEQSSPASFVIGSNTCTVDIYNIRIYDNSLSGKDMVDNWISDTPELTQMLTRYKRNDIRDEYGAITIEKLPNNLPYLVMQTSVLPSYKGDKQRVSGYFVDPTGTHPNFSFTNAEYDVQGTSSQYYARKNFKAKYKNGFVLDNEETVSKIAAVVDGIPVNAFCYKVDVASSEGANNAVLAMYYDDLVRNIWETSYQEEDERIRQGVGGFPFVLFYDDLSGGDPVFYGKGNFLYDKGSEDVFGFTDGDESWEIKNNTTNLALFKDNDFETTYVNTDNETVARWKDTFEGRYPDKNETYTNLKVWLTWLMSTDTTAATNNSLSPSVTIDGVTYTTDTAEYRLAKFKSEASQYLEMEPVLFYYLFTEAFLMVDSRAKNMFPTFMGGSKWFSLPYDFDTALGIDNEGVLSFSYNLEDIDVVSGANVYNGQDSVLWKNIRSGFYPQLSNMYKTLRSTGKFSYNYVENLFEQHQGVWPEDLFNEDSEFKYIDPLVVGTPDRNGNIVQTDVYLDMLQGSKTEQRKWWLYNRFKYLDSKYVAGEALTDVIQLRGYAKDNITITPFNDIYVDVKFGSSTEQIRGSANTPTTIVCPLDTVSDTEIYIYSASQLKSISDLTGLKIGFVDLSNATKLQTITIHDDSGHPNLNLTRLGLGNNTLLKTIICRDAPNLTSTIDLSNCTSIQTVNFGETGITGVSFADGAGVVTLIVPDTITNLTLKNTVALATLTIGDNTDYSNLSTLVVENVPLITEDYNKLTTILDDMADNSRIRLIGLDFTFSTAQDVDDFKNILDRFKGVDDSGTNVDTAQVSGTISLPGTISNTQFSSFTNDYPYITFEADRVLSVNNGHLIYSVDELPIDIPTFDVNLEDGHLYMTGLNDIFVSGNVNSDGHLIVEVAEEE